MTRSLSTSLLLNSKPGNQMWHAFLQWDTALVSGRWYSVRTSSTWKITFLFKIWVIDGTQVTISIFFFLFSSHHQLFTYCSWILYCSWAIGTFTTLQQTAQILVLMLSHNSLSTCLTWVVPVNSVGLLLMGYRVLLEQVRWL